MCNMAEIMDITKIKISDDLSSDEKAKKFKEEVKNPYEFKIGGTIVKIKFNDSGKTLNEQLEYYFKSL